MAPLVALHTEELCVEYKADLGRLRTCYLGAKKSRNRSLKQRFAVGLRSCQLKADHGLPKDSRDKITGRHTKNVACPEFLWRVTKVPQSQLWVERAGLPYPSANFGFLPAVLNTWKKESCLGQPCPWSRGASSIPGLISTRLSSAPHPDLHHTTTQIMRGQNKGAGPPQKQLGWLRRKGVRGARQAEDGPSHCHLPSFQWT